MAEAQRASHANTSEKLKLSCFGCLTLCDPMDCNPTGSSVHRDSPGKSPGVGCVSSSRQSSQPRDRTYISRTAGRFFTAEPPEKLPFVLMQSLSYPPNPSEFGESAFTHYYFVLLLVTSLLFLHPLCKSTEL